VALGRAVGGEVGSAEAVVGSGDKPALTVALGEGAGWQAAKRIKINSQLI